MWLFVRLPVEPMVRLDLSNDLPGLKRDVRLEFDRDRVRYLGWTPGEAPAGAVRILCLGGSATFAVLQNAEDTWWGRLRAGLEKNGHTVQIAAWGQDRAGIAVSANIGGTLISELKPDLVIGNFGFDDVVAQPVEYKYNPAKTSAMPGLSRPTGWKQALVKVSQIARLYRHMVRGAESDSAQNTFGRTDQYKNMLAEWRVKVAKLRPVAGPVRVPPDDPLQEYLDGWKALHAWAKRDGAALLMTGEASLDEAVIGLSQQEVLTALMPVDYATGEQTRLTRPDPAWVEQEMTRFSEAAAGFAKANNLVWFDLNGRVARTLDHFLNDVMFTDAGAAEAAKELVPVVEPLLKAK